MPKAELSDEERQAQARRRQAQADRQRELDRRASADTSRRAAESKTSRYQPVVG